VIERLLATCVCLGVVLGSACPAEAIVERRTDISDFADPGSDWYGMTWDYIGQVGVGSAVAVGMRYMLSNRHFTIGPGSTVTVDGTPYTVTETYNVPDWGGSNTPDLRLFKVDAPLPGYYELYDGAFADPDKRVILAGTGYDGTINVGDSTYTWSTSTGRGMGWGTNEHESFVQVTSGIYTSFCMQMNFDVGDTAYEAGIASGDSGSGVFYNDGGTWKLAGVSAYVGAQVGGPPWDRNYAISMFPHADWIRENAVLAGDVNDDGLSNADDIDLLCDNLGGDPDIYDMDDDGDVDADDQVYLIENFVELQDGSGRVGTKPGDFNLDGLVDLADLTILKTNAGLTGIGYADGNANCDDVVDLADLTILRTNAGWEAPAGPVPEPATVALLLVGGAAALLRRRRR